MKTPRLITSFLIVGTVALGATASDLTSLSTVNCQLVSTSSSSLTLRTELPALQSTTVEQDGVVFTTHTLDDEGATYDIGQPILPAVTRIVVVSPNENIELIVRAGEPRRVRELHPPLLYEAEDGSDGSDFNSSALYPPNIAEMSEPFVIRGVRMVKVTTYPVRYDPASGEYLYYDRIETEIRTTSGVAVNPALYPDRTGRSKSFQKFLNALAINSASVGRDDPVRDDPMIEAHYLIVTHENCVEYIRPFIEWKRKSGNNVDILSIQDENARNPGLIKELIQERYDSYLNNGMEPFDQILLVGDRSSYNQGPNPQWILDAYEGNSNWNMPEHADYLYACLEGDDERPDCGIARWIAGSEETLELAVRRTLAYEAIPDMADPGWFGRAAAYSQHWGNGPESEWHQSVPLNARWGREILKAKGFDDIAFYEEIDYDAQGNQIGPWLAERVNEKTNLMVGRAQNWYWRNELQEVRDNTVFPINITAANHSDMVGTMMFREGDGDHLRGFTAVAFTWGEIGTTSTIFGANIVWSQMVSGFLNHELPLGWARVYAITKLEQYVPNFQFGGWGDFYPVMRTDFDAIGDPGLQPWMGTPRTVNAELLSTTFYEQRLFEVAVTDPEGEAVGGATVTFYAPGELPGEPEDYAEYSSFVSRTALTDDEGLAQFIFPTDITFVPETPLFITVTGRDILPEFIEEEFFVGEQAVELTGLRWIEIQGNGDGEPNPSESIALGAAFTNTGRNALTNINARFTSDSPWIEIDGDNSVEVGDLAAGEAREPDEQIQFTLHPAVADRVFDPENVPTFQVEITSDQGEWKSALQVESFAPGIAVVGVRGGNVIPIEQSNLDIDLRNGGRFGTSELLATLSSLTSGVIVIEEESTYPSIATNETEHLNGDPFEVVGSSVTPPGSIHKMQLILESEDGWTDTVYFDLQIDEPHEGAPQVADGYGYICFDDTDVEWDSAPVYEWVELDVRREDADFEGELLELALNVEHNMGDAVVVDLPFETQFYGKTYDQITVASNGFIAMGDQEGITNSQNLPLDLAIGGGAGMIAPLWTDLRLTNVSGVFTYYDEQESRFIIEWSKLSYRWADHEELTFQVILLDRDVWITESGDQEIEFYYKQAELIVNLERGNDGWRNQAPYPSVGISSPDGTTGISYCWNNRYPESNARIEDRRAIKFATSTRFRAAGVYGRVTDFETGEPISQARINTEHGFITSTDEEGYYSLAPILADIPFDLTASAQGYNDSTVTIEPGVEEGDSLEVNFALLHPEFLLSQYAVSEVVFENREFEQVITISNDGNGPLVWRAEKRLLGGMAAEPWETRRTYAISEVTDDARIEGVVFAADRIYLSGANDADPNLIYILNRDGELIDSIEQVGSSRYGYKDMEWDGELIWACGEDSIYGFTPDGQFVRRWERNHLTPFQYVAINANDGILYLSGTTSNIYQYDYDGNLIDEELDNKGLRIYGLSYWPEDPDGYCLYMLHRPTTNSPRSFITKMDVTTGDTITVRELRQQDGSTGSMSLAITNQFDIYSWVMFVLQNVASNNGGDIVEVVHLDARREWFDMNHFAGQLECGESEDIILSLRPEGLPDTTFIGEVYFTHNADSGKAYLEIEMTVMGWEPQFSLLSPEDGDTLFGELGTLPPILFEWQRLPVPEELDSLVEYIHHLSVGDASVSFTGGENERLLDLDSLSEHLDNFSAPLIWSVTAVFEEEQLECWRPFTLNVVPLSTPGDPSIPVEFGLAAIYPSPFNSSTSIRFGVETAGNASLKVFDLQGREVVNLFEDNAVRGYHTVVWNAGDLAAGVYLLQMESNSRHSVRKVVLVR